MFCSKCGKEIEDADFCPYCGYRINKNKESVKESEFKHAGFWNRFGAYVIDAIIIFVCVIFIFTLFSFGNNTLLIDFGFILSTLFSILYFTIQESSEYQATLGKRAVGIIVTDLNGRRISFWRALGRYFAKILSFLILFIGVIMIGFTEKKQGLHDMIVGTFVIEKPKEEPVNSVESVEKKPVESNSGEHIQDLTPASGKIVPKKPDIVESPEEDSLRESIKKDEGAAEEKSEQEGGANIESVENDKAEEWYLKAEKLDPVHEREDMIKYCNKAIDISPMYVDAINLKGVALYTGSEYDEAIECFNQVLEISKNTNHLAWFNKGNTLMHKGDYNEAAICFDRATEIFPDPDYLKGKEMVSQLQSLKAKKSVSETFNREKSKEILDQVSYLLDDSLFFNENEVHKLEKLVIESGNEGLPTFKKCLDDVFSIRAYNFDMIWQPALEVAKQTKDEELFSFIEKVVWEGGDLVNGSPSSPSWMPSLHTDIIGGGKFGWSDGIWIGLAKSGAEFLRDNLELLPSEVIAEHRNTTLNACAHRLDIWKSVKEGGSTINIQHVEEEISYWTNMAELFK